MVNQVICDHPKIILNPEAHKLVFQHRHYYVAGKEYFYNGRSYTGCKNLINSRFIVNSSDYSVDLLENSFILSESGEMFPFYIQVPCGYCPNCIMSKQSSFVQRCTFETMCYNTWPWFVTLTYKDKFLPPGEQLRIRDVQNFLKRFRVLLDRKFDGLYSSRIRYAVCGEYGKGARPHYHMIVWNLKSLSSVDYRNIKKLIYFAWSRRLKKVDSDLFYSNRHKLDYYRYLELSSFDFKRELIGWVTTRVVNPSKKDDCFKYTMKYIIKPPREQHLPYVGAKRPFLCSSRTPGVGSIGKKFALELRPNINPSGLTKPLYFHKFLGKPQNVFTNKWIIDQWFPSKCRFIPSNVRKALFELSFYEKSHEYFCKLPSYVVTCLKVWRNHFFDPFSLGSDLWFKPDNDIGFNLMVVSDWMFKLDKWTYIDLDMFFIEADLSQFARDCYLAGLFSSADPVNVSARSYKATRLIQRQISNEVL